MNLAECEKSVWYTIDDPGNSRLKKDETILFNDQTPTHYHVIGERLCDEVGILIDREDATKILLHRLTF